MDKLDMILEQLKETRSSQERIEADIRALKNDNKEIHKRLNKLDTIDQKVDQTWQAVKEMREDITTIKEELTENSVKINIIDNKVKAL